MKIPITDITNWTESVTHNNSSSVVIIFDDHNFSDSFLASSEIFDFVLFPLFFFFSRKKSIKDAAREMSVLLWIENSRDERQK